MKMMEKNTKKVILIIVEGISDKFALEGIIKTILGTHSDTVEIVTYDSDLLTNTHCLNAIKEKVEKEISINHLYTSDIVKIAQISDVDGCYIDDSKIIPSDTKIKYFDDHIECIYPDDIILRNKKKRESIKL